MKILKILIGISIIAVLGISLWNRFQLQKYVNLYNQQKEENQRTLHAVKEIEKAVISGQSYAMTHLGKTFLLANVEKIFPDKTAQDSTEAKPKLILILSELSCNVCADKESQFAVEFLKKYGPGTVLAVVHATNRKYVRTYIRLNQINFPVYFCESNTEGFFADNEILNTPLLLLVDETNRILASSFPIPGHLEYSEPFHNFCHYYFKNNVQ